MQDFGCSCGILCQRHS